MLRVLLLGIFLAPTLAGLAPSHYVGGRARFPCGIQSSNTSVFLDGARLPADDPNVMITSDMVVVTSIPSEWNNTALQCKGVSSDGRTELVGLKSRIIVYDQLVVQHPNIDVASGVANISWSYPWTHLDSPLNCSVALYNKTDLSPVDTETTASESYVVTDQEVLNCVACGGCFVTLTIKSRDYTGPSLQYRHSETTAASRPSESYLNISVQEISVVVSFYLVPAVCEVTPLWVKRADTNARVISAFFDVVELGAESIGVSMVTLSISGLTVDTRASYVIGLRVVWNGNRRAKVLKIPIKISPKPTVAPFSVHNDTSASFGTDVATIASATVTGVVVLFVVLVIIPMLAVAMKKCLDRAKKSYDLNESSAMLTSPDVEGTGSPMRREVTTLELTSGGLPIPIADTVPEESPQLKNTSPPESPEPRSCPDIETVQKESVPSKAEPTPKESSTESVYLEVITPEPLTTTGVEGVQNRGSNTVSVVAGITPRESSTEGVHPEVVVPKPRATTGVEGIRNRGSSTTVSVVAEVTPGESSLPSEIISTPPVADSSTSTVSEEAEVTPEQSSPKGLLSEIISTPPESDSSTSTVSEEAEVTPVESSLKDLPSEITSTPPESDSSTSTVSEEAEVTLGESCLEGVPSEITSTPPAADSSTSTVSEEAEVTPEESSSKDLPSEVTSTPPESDSSTSTVSVEAEVTPVESSLKDLPSVIISTPPESSSSTSTVTEEAEVTPSPQGHSCLLSNVVSTQDVQKAGFTPTPELTDDEGYMVPESELFKAAIAVVNDQDHPKKEDGQYTGTDPQDATPTSSLGRRQPPAQQQHRGDVEITTDGVGIQSEPKQFPNKYDDPDLP